MSVQELESVGTAWQGHNSTLPIEDRPRIQRGATRLRLTANTPERGLRSSSTRLYTDRVLEGVQALIKYREQSRMVVIDYWEEEPLDIARTIIQLLKSPSSQVGCIPTRDRQSFQEEASGTGLSYNFPEVPLGQWLETVDWELKIEPPPPRSSRTVMVKFEKGSYRPPRIVGDPEE